MRHYVRSSLGVDAPVPVEQQAPAVTRSAPSAAPNFTRQALGWMAYSALPWMPVAAGAWVGERFGSKGWGAVGGFALSFLVIRSVAKGIAGK